MRTDGGSGIERVGLWKASVARFVLSEMPTIADEGAEADLAIKRTLSPNGSESEWCASGTNLLCVTIQRCVCGCNSRGNVYRQQNWQLSFKTIDSQTI